MKKLNYILILLVITVLFSCKQDDILFTNDMASVGFYGENATMMELDKSFSGQNEVVVKILVTALKNSPSCDVTIEVDNSWYQEIDGEYFSNEDEDNVQVNPAIEGVDFQIMGSKTVTVSEGYGYAYITIKSINNDYYDPLGNKSFRLKIAGNSLGYNLSSESVMKITIADDDHPLNWFLGEYNSMVVQTLNGDEQFPIYIDAVAEETDKVKIYGMCGLSKKNYPDRFGAPLEDPYYIIGTVSEDSTKLIINAGQEWEDWAFGTTIFNVWEDDNGDGEEVDILTGVINTENNGVSVTFNQASRFLLTSGDFEGYSLQWVFNEDENTNSITSVWTKQ